MYISWMWNKPTKSDKHIYNYKQTSLLGGEVARNRKFSPVIAEFYDL